MRCPVCKTHPAELVVTRANSAGHVVAALVLLDGSLTFGTGFRICHNPGQVLRLSTRFFVPLSHDIAVGWRMFLLAA